MSCLKKTKEVLSAYSENFNIQRTLSAVDENLDAGQSGAAIGQCKNAIESICKTILDKKLINYDSNIAFPKLVKTLIKVLRVEEVGTDSQGTHEAFLKFVTSICSTLENTAESLATLRNEYCPESHGRSDLHPDLPKEFAEFIIMQADSLMSFIICLIQRHNDFKPPIQFTDNEDFNDYLYEEFKELEIFGDLYQAPEILFHLNNQKYQQAVEEFKLNRDSNND
ncbi:MAG: abortive infection family protein [Flavobacteriaceae bacterium]|nr:abortive infection family protein [Flavobacteriaceae bacterium]